MFATQNFAEGHQDGPRKRGRDDEQDMSTGNSSFGEHRNKRLQSLPVRTSPRAGQRNVTPLTASPAELRHSHIESRSYMSRETQDTQQDMDMDMMDGVDTAACYDYQPNHLAPQGDPASATNRMPTPIQPSFAAQVKGQQREWAAGGAHDQSSSGNTVPRTMASEGDWQNVHNNRRLPSPISEGDDSMQMSMQPPSPHEMEHPNAMMDVESRASLHPTETDGDSPAPSPERRGHMRSKHTINSWTWQPGMKKSFSIGYRADCEKCRLKVPGHFNHIVIS